ncbi:MAG: histidine phosphatase family protein [Nannocystis sp.]|nr:histidine phosphatase family protein [Nannocystis sp.]
MTSPRMPRLIAALIRHAAYEQPEGVPSAHLPYPLTAQGVLQASLLGDTLAERVLAGELRLAPTIHSSSLRRAWQTATLLAEALHRRLGVAFEVDQHDALAERGLGAFANLSVSAIEALVASDPRYSPLPPGWKADSYVRVPAIGAETLDEAGQRVAAHIEAALTALEAAAAALPPDPPLVQLFIGHGAALRHAALRFGVLGRTDLPRLSMHYARPVLLERTAPRTYRHHSGEWKLRRPTAEPTD